MRLAVLLAVVNAATLAVVLDTTRVAALAVGNTEKVAAISSHGRGAEYFSELLT